MQEINVEMCLGICKPLFHCKKFVSQILMHMCKPSSGTDYTPVNILSLRCIYYGHHIIDLKISFEHLLNKEISMRVCKLFPIHGQLE